MLRAAAVPCRASPSFPAASIASRRRRASGAGGKRQQAGIALLAMLVLLTLWGLYLFIGQLDTTRLRLANDRNEAEALQLARETLLANAISQASINDAAYLRLPDLGANMGVPTEGVASTNFAGNGTDRSVLGKFPWRTLNTAPLRDASGECLWYLVSGRFQVGVKTDALNWDTPGQIDILDGGGNVVASKLAAVVVAVGRALDGQSRTLADAAYSECGGNYDARNYLDSFNGADALGGQLNYFAGSTNNRVALDTNDKSFVMAETDHYNDRFLFLTVENIFEPLIRRSDFAAAIAGFRGGHRRPAR